MEQTDQLPSKVGMINLRTYHQGRIAYYVTTSFYFFMQDSGVNEMEQTEIFSPEYSQDVGYVNKIF